MSQKPPHYYPFLYFFTTPLFAQKTRTQLEADRKRIKKEILQVNKHYLMRRKKGKKCFRRSSGYQEKNRGKNSTY